MDDTSGAIVLHRNTAVSAVPATSVKEDSQELQDSGFGRTIRTTEPEINTCKRADDGKPEDGFEIMQFLQLDKVRHLPGVEIAWNEVFDTPGESRGEAQETALWQMKLRVEGVALGPAMASK